MATAWPRICMVERKIVWHPRGESKFVVGGGSQVTLYEWSSEPSIVQQASQHDLSMMKCFAWSPDAHIDDLLAVGLSSGRVELLRLESARRGTDHVASRGPHAQLPPKSSRACTALAFCPAAPNFLAVGLDKVRSDASLVLWDIATTTPALSFADAPPLSPVRTAFSLPRHDSFAARADPRIVQTHAPTESVHALAWLPATPHVLAAALSSRWLRLFDVRAPAKDGAITPAHPVGKITALATDPSDGHRLAAAVDGAVCVWDVRRMPGPLITFTPRDAAADGTAPSTPSQITSLEFSSAKRGLLATLERDAHCVRLWDVLRTELGHGETRERAMRTPKVSWTSGVLPWSSAAGQRTEPESPAGVGYTLLLADTRKSKRFRGPLSSFALVPSPSATTTTILGTTKEGDLELSALPHGPAHATWSPRGAFSLALGPSLRVFSGVPAGEDAPAHPWAVQDAEADQPEHLDLELRERGRSPRKEDKTPRFGRGDDDGFPALASPKRPPSPGRPPPYIKSEQPQPQPHPPPPPPPSELLKPPPMLVTPAQDSNSRSGSRLTGSSKARHRALERVQSLVSEDLSMVARSRALAGYGLGNPTHNASLFPVGEDMDSTMLRIAWTWTAHARRLPSLVHGYDFRPAGLLSLWDGFPPTHPSPSQHQLPALPAHLSSSSSPARSRSKRGRHRAAPDASAPPPEFTAALSARVPSLPSTPPWRPAAPTSRLLARCAGLDLLNWSLNPSDVEAAIARWISAGHIPRAATWLVFTGQHDRAVDLLLHSDDESCKAMAGTVAALSAVTAGGGELAPAVRQYYDKLILRLEDTYFSVMLRYLALGDWGDVLEEEALPLRERLAIALQFLDDAALGSYLRRVAESASGRGNLDGLLVTGLGKGAKGVDLVQAYVDRTGDVQSAALLAAHAGLGSRGERDTRVCRWIEAYRDLLDGWRLFCHRVQFDVDRGQIAMAGGRGEESGLGVGEMAPRQVLLRCNYCNKVMSSPPGAHATGRDTACPHCGRPLPRCSVCLMYLSILPDPTRDALHAHHNATAKDTLDDAIVFCQTCRHGGHASHIMEWFYGSEDGDGELVRSRGVCPVADCTHRCADELCSATPTVLGYGG